MSHNHLRSVNCLFGRHCSLLVLELVTALEWESAWVPEWEKVEVLALVLAKAVERDLHNLSGNHEHIE